MRREFFILFCSHSLIASPLSFLSLTSRRAVEICEYDSRRESALSHSAEQVNLSSQTTTSITNASRCTVEMKHIDRAVKELFASPFTPFMQTACLHEKLCLISCLLETRFRGSQSVPMVQVYERYCNICSSHRIFRRQNFNHKIFRPDKWRNAQT